MTLPIALQFICCAAVLAGLAALALRPRWGDPRWQRAVGHGIGLVLGILFLLWLEGP